MTKAPERIWIERYGRGIRLTEPDDAARTWSVEYARADLCDPLSDPRVRALVDAAHYVCEAYYDQDSAYVSGMSELAVALAAFREGGEG